MKLLVVTQRVDHDDDVLGFFHGWLGTLSPLVQELHVITLYEGSHDLPANTHVYSLGKERGASRTSIVVAFHRSLARLLPIVDGVFCHMCPEYVLGVAPWNVWHRKPILFWYAHARVSGMAKRALARATRVLSPSIESFDVDTKKLVPTGHGIDTERFSPLPMPEGSGSKDEVFRIVNVNRVSRVKDVGTLVEAVRVLVHQHRFTDFRVRIVGGPARSEDESYFEELKARARDAKLERHLEWVGSVPNKLLAPYYHDADAFVRMQHGGGYGKNELEALACGLPAIVCTPVYEPVFGRFTTSLIWKEKDPGDLAEKILRTARWSDADRREFRSLAREYVLENHDLKTLAAKIVTEMEALTDVSQKVSTND